MTLSEIEATRNASSTPADPCMTINSSRTQSHQSTHRPRAMIHPCVDPPLCEDCTRLELSFFDPVCPGCSKILTDPSTAVPEIFAIMRQWTPQTQQSMEMLVDEILKRGAGVNDRDGLTDMTLLHYATKSGAAGIGDSDSAMRVTSMLIDAGADVHIRCRWTNMTALHYAAYFDVVSVIKVLLKATGALDIDSTCSEFEHGTSLHIAASNLAHEACKVLLQNGANPSIRDDLNRLPLDCVPDPPIESPGLSSVVMKLKKTLREAAPPSTPRNPPPNYDLVHSKVTLQALGLALGDKILVGGIKSGILRYCGPTEFASGVWAGVELDEAVGKNNGSVGGFSYFNCAEGHGIFAPISKITKLGAIQRTRTPPVSQKFPAKDGPAIDVSRVTAKVDTGLNKQPSPDSEIVGVDDRVVVAGQRKGTVKFIGETQFAAGQWYGVELDKPVGKNDGSVNGVYYFSCRPQHGVFAPLSRIHKLGDKRFSSNESLDTISWGALSEKVDRRKSTPNRPRSTITPTRAHPPVSLSRVPGQSNNQVLEPGTQVLCNNELGTIRYIGPADFADGTWLGVELRKPKGRNDGSVGGKRYFCCAPNCGIMVKPSRVTVRGINGARILAEQTAGLAMAENIVRATSGNGSITNTRGVSNGNGTHQNGQSLQHSPWSRGNSRENVDN